MAIIVDGYNVLHTAKWLSGPWKDTDRHGLCHLLGKLSKLRGEKITVVFDALPTRGDSYKSVPIDVEVVFSGHNRTADDIIIQMIRQSTGPRDLTVVSSDHEIRTAARSRACTVITAGNFVKGMSEQLAQADKTASSEPQAKQQGLGGQETDRWLTEFGIDPDQPDDPYEPMRRG